MICGITTAPRQKCFLEETVSSVFLSGFRDIFVFAEPGSEIPEKVRNVSWVMESSVKRGQWRNWLWMATRLCNFSSKIVLTAEDDVCFARSAARESREVLKSLILSYGNECGPLCVYTSSVYQNKMNLIQENPGMVEQIDSRSLTGSCALLWPLQALRRVVEHKTAIDWQGISGKDSGSDIRHSDTCIGMCCHELGLKVFGMKPCLAQHVGIVSSLGRDEMNETMFASHVSE